MFPPYRLVEDSADLPSPCQREELTNGSREEYKAEEGENAVEVTREFIAGPSCRSRGSLSFPVTRAS